MTLPDFAPTPHERQLESRLVVLESETQALRGQLVDQRERVVQLQKVKRLASSLLISPYEPRISQELALAIIDYDERWKTS